MHIQSDCNLYNNIYIFKQAPNLILQEANYFQILYMLWHMTHFITRDSPSNQFTLFEMFLRRCFPSLNSFKNFNKLVKYKIQQPQIFTVYNIYNKFLSPHFSLWSFFSFSFFFFFFLRKFLMKLRSHREGRKMLKCKLHLLSLAEIHFSLLTLLLFN